MEDQKYMTVREMGDLLGLKKTDRYWLIHKGYFQTKVMGGRTYVDVESFERWYANQIKYHKVSGEEPGREVNERTYSIRELAEMFEVHESTIYAWIKRYEWETVLVGGWLRIPKESFERWYAGQTYIEKVEDPAEEAPASEEGANGERDIEPEEREPEARPLPKYITCTQAARIAGVTPEWINTCARNGKFTLIRLRSGNRIPTAEFYTWLEERRGGS